MIFRALVIPYLIVQAIQPVLASDDLDGIDKARVFPVQKNKTVIHDPAKSTDSASEISGSISYREDINKTPPKDTTLNINGNGGSTSRPAGGGASLRKRFTFD